MTDTFTLHLSVLICRKVHSTRAGYWNLCRSNLGTVATLDANVLIKRMNK